MTRTTMKQGSCLLLFGLLPALTASPARADSAPPIGAGEKVDRPIELLAGSRREISVDPDPEERIEVRFPIKLPDAQAPGKVSVHPLAATCGLRDESAFLKRVTGDVLTDSASRTSVLRLQLDLQKPVKPCTYDLKLALEPPGAEPWPPG
jgi:hypothetical protein